MKQFERLQVLENLLMQPPKAMDREHWGIFYGEEFGRTVETFSEDIAELNRLLNVTHNLLDYDPDDKSTRIKYVYTFKTKYYLKQNPRGYFYSYFNRVQQLNERDWQYLANIIEYNAELFDDSFINKFTAFKAQQSIKENDALPWNPVQLLNDGRRPGKHLFSELLTAIQNRKAIEIRYQHLDDSIQPSTKTILPLLLKEYSSDNSFISGWYLLAAKLNPDALSEKVELDLNKLWVYALDRIININVFPTKLHISYPDGFDPKNYFKDTLGISRNNIGNPSLHPERIVIQTVKKEDKSKIWIYPYLKRYPIHHSMKILDDNGKDYLKFELNLEIDNELITFVLKHAQDLEVVSPIKLRMELKAIIEEAYKNYCNSV
jgi:predicted DNA-binding transcriptional regulator YafY